MPQPVDKEPPSRNQSTGPHAAGKYGMKGGRPTRWFWRLHSHEPCFLHMREGPLLDSVAVGNGQTRHQVNPLKSWILIDRERALNGLQIIRERRPDGGRHRGQWRGHLCLGNAEPAQQNDQQGRQ